MQLRPYQSDAVMAVLNYYERGNTGNVLLALPTGSGKSVIQAAIIREILARWPGERFLLLAHAKELLSQNAAKIAALCPGVSVGIYSAGLGRKELGHQVTIAGIQSVHRMAHKLGDMSIIFIDECHLVSKGGDTMYRRLIADLAKYCPHAKIVGMSATPWRLDSGPLIKGKDRIFTDIAYSISIKELIDQGYLSPLTTSPTTTRIKTDGVAKRGGEFIAGELEKAANVDAITKAAIDEVELACADRKSWLVFAVGVDHAKAVCAEIARRGIAAEAVTGETSHGERDAMLARFKRGELRALVSVGVLTTGFDAPCADALINLRPTLSPGLWVQIVGRVSRLHPGKENGLVLDFTNNTRTHGPVDLIEVDGDGNLKTSPAVMCAGCFKEYPGKLRECPHCGLSRFKECKECQGPVPLGVYECPTCGHIELPPERKIKHETKASDAAILSSGDRSMKEKVVRWEMVRHRKDGRPDSMAVSYYASMITEYREWVCFEHTGFAGEKAAQWWYRRGGKAPAPARVADALARTSELVMPDEITVKRNGKWWEVVR
jgi:DNA repair protein RadD